MVSDRESTERVEDPDLYFLGLSATTARSRLVLLLQQAYSGERAAAAAYRGHAASVSRLIEKAEIGAIEEDEVCHRRCVGEMLEGLGARPAGWREVQMAAIGAGISFLCHLGGWLIPMWGAGKLEAGNIVEYEDAARFATVAQEPELVERLLEMAEVEWDHERYFRGKVLGHPLGARLPIWPEPAPRPSIRERFDSFLVRARGRP